MEEKKLALLIDGDNISSKYIKTIIDESTAYGVVTYKRIYGDWTKPNLDSWKKELLEYSINPMQQYAYTSGKNATDSAMIIDAMDILYTKTVDGFILVSSDSDFTRLAARLKESGMIVIGMGKTQTPKPFVSACSQFKFLDVLSEENDEIDKQEDVKKTTKLRIHSKTSQTQKEDIVEQSSKTPLKDILQSISKIIAENSDEEGWVSASIIGIDLTKKHSDFDVRNYNCKKLSEFLEKNGYEINKIQDPNNIKNPTGYLIYVRENDVKKESRK